MALGWSKTKALTLLGVPRSRLHYESNPRPKKKHPVPHRDRAIRTLSNTQINGIVTLLEANPHSSIEDVFYAALNNGIYIASLSSFYRVAKNHNLLLYQRHGTKKKKSSRRHASQPPHVVADNPKRVLCWDTTYLPGPTIRAHFHCHTVIDLYSRKIVGAVVTERDTAGQIKELFAHILANNPTVTTVHSDNGPLMTNTTLAKLFASHDVTASFSRPYTSNDNPHIESVFHTLKGRTYYPHSFANITQAKQWVEQFVTAYNNRPHGTLNGYTPNAVHDGTWRTHHNTRYDAINKALDKGWITTPPTTLLKPPPPTTSIIRTTTATQPQPTTINTNPELFTTT